MAAFDNIFRAGACIVVEKTVAARREIVGVGRSTVDESPRWDVERIMMS